MNDLELLVTEMAYHGIRVGPGKVSLLVNGKIEKVSYDEAIKAYRDRAERNRKILLSVWERLKDTVAETAENEEQVQ